MNDQQPSRLPTKDVSPDPVKIATPQSMSLYAKREKIHARSITGFFQSIRVYTLWLTMGLFLLMPWVTWEGRQALLFDLPNRKFYIFWWTFLPQDFFFLSWMLIMGAFACLWSPFSPAGSGVAIPVRKPLDTHFHVG
jgi:hypothetical protein